jgi:hypothetical protein
MRSHEPDAQTPGAWCGSLHLTSRSLEAGLYRDPPSRPALHWHSGWEPASAHETALSHRIAINLNLKLRVTGRLTPGARAGDLADSPMGPGNPRGLSGRPRACRAAGHSRTRAGSRARSESRRVSRRHCARGPGVFRFPTRGASSAAYFASRQSCGRGPALE